MVIPPPTNLVDFRTLLVDESIGIIHHVKELPVEPGSPNFFHFYARACNTMAFCAQRNSADAGGASTSRERALAKAMGEALERYCGALYNQEDLPLSSFESAPFSCVVPTEFALYTPAQIGQKGFPFVAFEKTTKLHWIPAIDIMSNKSCHVPACMVFVPYRYDREKGEWPILQPISTGLACHMGYWVAGVSAICEVIERDAFTIYWQAQLSPQRIEIKTLSEANQEIVSRFEGTGKRVNLFLLRMDHRIPVILSVLNCRETEMPSLCFALSCHLNPEIAVRKSLEELAHSYRFCRLLKNSRPRFPPTPDFSNVVDRDSHVALYCDHKNIALADFLFRSRKKIPFAEIGNQSTGDAKKDLGVLRKEINSIGHRILLIDLTTPELQNLGIFVIRAVIPGLHPLCVGHHIRALGGSRIREVPEKIGFRKKGEGLGHNSVPHPLP
ncbi:MAG: YcaO-like family protein [Nitrospirales bacterium]